MRIVLSKILNGPDINDNLGVNQGLDLSGQGIEAGQPGDSSYFSIYVRLESHQEEKVLYTVLEDLGIYLAREVDYNADYDSDSDYEDILTLGDLGFGLSLFNHETQDYDIHFNNTTHNQSSNRYIIAKQNLILFKDGERITMNGFKQLITTIDDATNIKIESNPGFNFTDYYLYNNTKNEKMLIKNHSGDEIELNSSVSWDVNDEVEVKKIINPTDGSLGISDEGINEFGNYFKLDFKFSLPQNYSRNKNKQFNFQITNKD